MREVKGAPLLYLTIRRLVLSVWPSLYWARGHDGDGRWLSLGCLEFAWLDRPETE